MNRFLQLLLLFGLHSCIQQSKPKEIWEPICFTHKSQSRLCISSGQENCTEFFHEIEAQGLLKVLWPPRALWTSTGEQVAVYQLELKDWTLQIHSNQTTPPARFYQQNPVPPHLIIQADSSQEVQCLYYEKGGFLRNPQMYF